jgi:hypothetical protein
VGFLRRAVMTVAAIGAAGAIAAGGSVPALATTTSGVRYQQVQTATILLGPGLDQCSVIALSATPSTGSPAYVSALVENWAPGACTGWIESSVNGGAWTNVSPQQVAPASQGPNNPALFKTGNYYAGPGTSVRACIEYGPAAAAATKCTSAVTLAASTATPADDATPVYWGQSMSVTIDSGPNMCFADVNTSTLTKAATSQSALILHAQYGGIPCTGWLESSSDNGRTWTQVTSTYSLSNAGAQTYAFSPAVADGTGQLIRACAQSTGAKVCSKGW